MEFLIKFHDIKLTLISKNMLKCLDRFSTDYQFRLFGWIVQFHQRLPDKTFGEILSEEFKKQIIAVRYWDRVDQAPPWRIAVHPLFEESPLQFFSPQQLAVDQGNPPDQIEGWEESDKWQQEPQSQENLK